jgi:hypothetical protein
MSQPFGQRTPHPAKGKKPAIKVGKALQASGEALRETKVTNGWVCCTRDTTGHFTEAEIENSLICSRGLTTNSSSSTTPPRPPNSRSQSPNKSSFLDPASPSQNLSRPPPFRIPTSPSSSPTSSPSQRQASVSPRSRGSSIPPLSQSCGRISPQMNSPRVPGRSASIPCGHEPCTKCWLVKVIPATVKDPYETMSTVKYQAEESEHGWYCKSCQRHYEDRALEKECGICGPRTPANFAYTKRVEKYR